MKIIITIAFCFFISNTKAQKTLLTDIKSVKKISSFIRTPFDDPQKELLKAGYKMETKYENVEALNVAAKKLIVWPFRTADAIENNKGADRGSVCLYESLAIIRMVDFSLYYGDHPDLYQSDLDELHKQIIAMGYKLIKKNKEGKIYKNEKEQRTIILGFEAPSDDSDGEIYVALGFENYFE